MTTPEQLITAVRAALDVRERIALAATPGEWRLGVMFGTVIADAGNVARDCYEQDAEHIAANDPATVLRLVASLREIVDMHEPCGDCGPGWSHRPECHRCAVPAPCSHLLALANLV